MGLVAVFMTANKPVPGDEQFAQSELIYSPECRLNGAHLIFTCIQAFDWVLIVVGLLFPLVVPSDVPSTGVPS